ncbi:putative short chain dehydrogenase protein [Rosellinia necatrix]|uniref:Putative short chain dehydrogenase protein n=1 Tax=Rosellinia necatrix TaxID=77044 RepID=A0A1S8ABI3_ROSNE|nr:putative short chain dehydrogenase protein [Rosellinia necatrix]
MTFHPDSLPDLKGTVFIVTGGNSGIGYHTVAHLARHGARVYMCARSPEKGAAAIAAIRAEAEAAAAGNVNVNADVDVELLVMDLADLGSVAAAASRFLGREAALHGLVNNAGVMATPFARTADGHEAQWQTNYLGHWLLTERLLPLLRRTAAALPPGRVRVVNLSSSGHLMAPRGGIRFDDPSLPDASPWSRYGQSKLANILHAAALHRAYGPGSGSGSGGKEGSGEIWVSSVHPGIVETNLAAPAEASGGPATSGVFSLVRLLGLAWPADKGAWTSLFCAAGPGMTAAQSGGYFDVFRRCGEPWWLSAAAKDAGLAERLDGWTRDLMRKEGWVQ